MTYFMYVDESGDPGLLNPNLPPHQQPSVHYILSGLIIPITEWRNYLTAIVEIRRQIRQTYGIPVRSEMKGAALINPRGNPHLRHLTRRQRVAVYQDIFHHMVLRMPQARIVNVYADKQNLRYPSSRNSDLEQRAWTFLIQRFHNFLSKQAFPSYGIIFADETNEVKLRRLLRKMRVYNPTPSLYGGYYHAPAVSIVEDPIMRNSSHSYFIQLCDLVAHSLYRKKQPRGGYRRYNVDRLFDILQPLLLTQASRYDPQGIVYL